VRKLVLILIALVAVFTFIRAYTDETQARQAAEATVLTESKV
jgi:Tfp pilus assembly protein PilV